MKKRNKEHASFRDPSGYIYYENNNVYRRIDKSYFEQYNYLMTSGLYEELVDKKLLIKHKEVEITDEYIIITPEKVPFISYPYEWCYEEIKDAALITLKIQEIALKYNMTLKDASAYNVQFYKGKATFIDTLSFDFYKEGEPWGAYGQFCRHFMSPLLLMAYVDENLNCLLKNYIDGIPVELANNILKGRGGLTAWQHIKLHSKSINKNNNVTEVKKMNISKISIINIISMLERQINSIKRIKKDTEWDKYYDNTNYDDIAEKSKINHVEKYLKEINLKDNDVIWDFGANDGKYSRIAAKNKGYVISYDIDYNAVNRNYNQVKKQKEENILPLLLDLTNPAPSIGFAENERKGLTARSPVKCTMLLALIHHICISNNVPFDSLSNWLSKISKYIIIEFVPKEDSQVEKLLKTRKDIFDKYDENNFEKEFKKYFNIIKKDKIEDSHRTIYLMESKNEE